MRHGRFGDANKHLHVTQPCLTQIKGVEPYSLHMTWTGGEAAGKVARLREAGLWRGDDPGAAQDAAGGAAEGAAEGAAAAYASDGRYLSIDLVWPRVRRRSRAEARQGRLCVKCMWSAAFVGLVGRKCRRQQPDRDVCSPVGI